jgi:hypothetical protein
VKIAVATQPDEARPIGSDPTRGRDRLAVIERATRLGTVALASAVLAACSPSALVVDVQPPGTVLFARSVDADTFQLRGELAEAAVGQDLSFRARLSRAAVGDPAIALSIDAQVLEYDPAPGSYDADYTLLAGTISGAAISEPGELVLRVTDLSDATLALGSIGVVGADQPAPSDGRSGVRPWRIRMAR